MQEQIINYEKLAEVGIDPNKYRELQRRYTELQGQDTSVEEAKLEREDVLQDFAAKCLELWNLEHAQGSRKGKGFAPALKLLGIPKGRAYSAMYKFFPNEGPPRKPRSQRTKSTTPAKTVIDTTNETIECVFVFPADQADQKSAVNQALHLIGHEEAQRLAIEAWLRCAEEKRGKTKTFLDEDDSFSEGPPNIEYMAALKFDGTIDQELPEETVMPKEPESILEMMQAQNDEEQAIA